MGFQYNDGDALPPFASEANKQLDAEIKRKEKDLAAVEETTETSCERIKIMTDHLVNVQQELVHTQQLVDAKKRETETEEHMMALTNRQTGRIGAEIIRLQKISEEYQDRTNSLHNEIFKGNEKLDQFKLEMNWNQEELEQWALAARQKEEDELTLEKYRRADDSKIRELTLAIEKLTVENSQKKKNLEEQVTETQAQQIEMDKTAEQFRSLHDDRKKLIQQWEEAVKNMKQRDQQLEQLGEDYAENLTRKKQKEQKMKEKQKFLQDSETENTKLEGTITAGDRQLARIRLDHMNVKSGLMEFKDEVEVLKNQLAAVATEQTNTKNKLVSVKKSLEERKVRYAAMHRQFLNTQKRLQDESQKKRDKEESALDAEKFHGEMMLRLHEAEKEMKAVKEELFKQSQELYSLRGDEATTLGEISGAQSAIKNLQFQISRLDQERQRQQELLYAVDFQSQLMQRKVARVSGERTLEEKEEFNKKIEQLEKQVEEQKSLHAILSAQIKRQDAELRSAQRTLQVIQKESDAMKGTMDELELQNSIMNRTVAQTVKEKEEVLVHHDIMKLEVKRLRGLMNDKSENLYSLENRKHQLQISMEEREKEIEVHQEVLKAQLRCAEEERHKAAIELAERKQKIYNLKMKYEVVVNKTKKDDGDGEGNSQAYYVLKAAQAKEELQRKGDELDEKIRKAEREIRALENTLGHLLTRNKKYKDNFQQANQQNQSELEEKQMLEEQSRAANEVLFRKKKNVGQLEKEFEEDTNRYDELQANVERLDAQVRELMGAKDLLDREIEDQQGKLERAERQMEVKRKQAQEAGLDLSQESPQVLDVELRTSRDMNQSVVWALSNALRDHTQDVLPLFESLCSEKNIQMPSRPPSATSRPGSSGGRGGGRPSSAQSGT